MIENLWQSLEQYISSGNLIAYIIVFAGGVLTSFTPCVYPVIPITIAYLGVKGEEKKSRNFFRAFSYVLGVALVYSILGATAALSGRIFGQATTSPWTYLLVGNICLFLGLSILGVFHVPIPKFLMGHRMPTQRKGILPSFLVGLSSGLVVGPCTAPILAVLLAYVGSKGNIIFGFTLLFTFAMGMGMLLLLIGTFAGIMARLPRSGPWLTRIEKFMGWTLIFVGEYFIFTAGKLSV